MIARVVVLHSSFTSVLIACINGGPAAAAVLRILSEPPGHLFRPLLGSFEIRLESCRVFFFFFSHDRPASCFHGRPVRTHVEMRCSLGGWPVRVASERDGWKEKLALN